MVNKKSVVYDFYLAGPVCHDESCNDWRSHLTEAVPEMRFFNPLVDGIEGVQKLDYRERFNGYRALADQGQLQYLSTIRHLMNSQVIPSDLAGIKVCRRGLICYVKRDKRAYGTICEIYEASQKQNKEVILVSELSYSEMNNWEIALATEIFTSMDSLIEDLRSRIVIPYESLSR